MLYATNAFAEVAGISIRQVQYWTDQGYLTPVHIEGRAAHGQGHWRVYDESEIPVAQMLAMAGDLAALAQAARTAVAIGAGRLTNRLVLVVDEGLES